MKGKTSLLATVLLMAGMKIFMLDSKYYAVGERVLSVSTLSVIQSTNAQAATLPALLLTRWPRKFMKPVSTTCHEVEDANRVTCLSPPAI